MLPLQWRLAVRVRACEDIHTDMTSLILDYCFVIVDGLVLAATSAAFMAMSMHGVRSVFMQGVWRAQQYPRPC